LSLPLGKYEGELMPVNERVNKVPVDGFTVILRTLLEIYAQAVAKLVLDPVSTN
jgi:hypothetical protein